MGSDQGFVDYVVDQLRPAGEVSARKMFGEFAIYQDGRIIALVCDNQLYLKPTTGGRGFIGEPTEAPPYPGSKPWYQVTDRVDDGDWLIELFVITAREVPAPKPKKRSETSGSGRAKPKRSTSVARKDRVKPKKRTETGTGRRASSKKR